MAANHLLQREVAALQFSAAAIRMAVAGLPAHSRIGKDLVKWVESLDAAAVRWGRPMAADKNPGGRPLELVGGGD